MKILQVRFKNLNSLLGEWEIDLSHPAFVSEGIFAITGPTGAGKTTILDAICLALYGKTPRLNKVTQNSNEIMSRRAGECFAEVTFETKLGRFRCHWSQHRSRKKAGGSLQTPKHEIADAVTGKVVEAKIRGVAEQIENTTGMDFDQFSRSMLLAQGSFAAFLQASADERSPILEQITGTEIYSKISIRVHEKRTEERKKLEVLMAEFSGIQLLGDEAMLELKQTLAQKNLQETDLEKQIVQLQQTINWLDGLILLEKDLAQLEEQKQDLAKRKEAFVPERQKLEKAVKALELSGEHARLVSMREEQETEQKTLRESQQKLPALETNIKQTDEALKLAADALAIKKSEQKNLVELTRKVRELDFQLKEKDQTMKAESKIISTLKTEMASLREKYSNDRNVLKKNREQLEATNMFLHENHTDAALAEHLAGLRERFASLRELDASKQGLTTQQKSQQSQFDLADQLHSRQLALQETINQKISDQKAVLLKQQQTLENTLSGQEIAVWRNAILQLKDRKNLLEQMVENSLRAIDTQKGMGELQLKETSLSTEKDLLNRNLPEQQEKQAGLEREVLLLETQLLLLKKIQDFDEARHQLQDGQPCPLCGALEHPFAQGNIPRPDETRETLNRVRGDLKKSEKLISGLKIREAAILKDLEMIAVQRKKLSEQQDTDNTRLEEGCSILKITRSETDPQVLRQLIADTDNSLQKTVVVVETVDQLEKDMLKSRKALEKFQEELSQSEKKLQTVVLEKAAAGQDLKRISHQLVTLEEQFKKAQEETLQELTSYGIDQLTVEKLDQIFKTLTKRRDRWQEQQIQKNDLEKKIGTLELQSQHQQEQISKLESELAGKQETLNALAQQQNNLLSERKQLFGDKNPDSEEARVSAEVDNAENLLERRREELNRFTQEHSQLKARIESVEKSFLTRNDLLKTSTESFASNLVRHGFQDELDYQNACLPEENRKNMQEMVERLNTEQTMLEARQRDKTGQLDAERKKQITAKPREQILQETGALQETLKTLRQEIGGIQQKLKDNEDLRMKQQERITIINAQQRECARWDLLHELIGSADGKKYRNFAQGLTFEMMIGHANQQLQKMTDRYLLLRDDKQPLELNVIDNYQAGEIRSTKNLSGGESFIVSLSLALGLSQMASRNVRVDSLFLDEGFGTLDEEALDTALETLAGLRADGKLIGVISHVPALKERINTQIQVIPQTGGRSMIMGPGCEKIQNSSL
ncbi:MAG: AAA family ATPase [SAR324 cluster bacterium]|nr:AAA family ATPase [SAR324 cluster bacterium]